jgi:hypothetical protein
VSDCTSEDGFCPNIRFLTWPRQAFENRIHSHVGKSSHLPAQYIDLGRRSRGPFWNFLKPATGTKTSFLDFDDALDGIAIASWVKHIDSQGERGRTGIGLDTRTLRFPALYFFSLLALRLAILLHRASE